MARDKRRREASPEELKKIAQERAEAEAEKDAEALPDGGWGWMVVLASLICNIIVDGICYSFGVFKTEYMHDFHTSNEQVGWVGSLLAGCYLTIGPLVSALAERYGSRKVTMVGAVIASAGFILSTQATGNTMLIATFGFIGGIGFGMIYLPAIVTVGHWFDKKRAFATGLAVCGTGIGTFIFPPLAKRLIEQYEWRGAHLILAGIVLNCAACGAIFRPLDRVKLKRRDLYQSQVEIQRGAIMKALIEEKKRQRTISNGSLDNCIITRDNRLIKLDPVLFECKRNNSFIARFKRSLGFSSQSLNKSKTSLATCTIPSIVIDAVNEARKESNGSRLSPIYRPSSKASSGAETTEETKSDGKAESPQSGASNDSGVCADAQKIMSDSISLNDLWLSIAQSEQKDHQESRVSSFHSVNNPIIFTGSAGLGLDASIISVQVLNGPVSGSCPSVHHRTSIKSLEEACYTNPAASTASFVAGSFLSIPQNISQYSIESVASQLRRESHHTCKKLLYTMRDMFEFQLLRSPLFALLVIASILTLFAFFIPFFYVTIKADELGRDSDESIFLLSLIGITNTIGRIISGWIADRPWTNPLHLNNGALIVAGIATFFVGLCESYILMCIYASVFGFCVAVFVSLRSILLVELLGIEMLTKSFGILILFQGVATMVGAPVAGRLLDTTGSVNGCFYLAGGLLLLSGLLGLPLRCLKNREKGKVPHLCPEEVPIRETLKIEESGEPAI